MCVFDEEKIVFPKEEEYDQFLERLFYRIKDGSANEVNIDDFRNYIERSGFTFADDEFEKLIERYCRAGDKLTMEEFKKFAAGKCIKLPVPR